MFHLNIVAKCYDRDRYARSFAPVGNFNHQEIHISYSVKTKAKPNKQSNPTTTTKPLKSVG